jgi:hypothetical protein
MTIHRIATSTLVGRPDAGTATPTTAGQSDLDDRHDWIALDLRAHRSSGRRDRRRRHRARHPATPRVGHSFGQSIGHGSRRSP